MFIGSYKKLLKFKYLDLSILSVFFVIGFLLRIHNIDKNLFFGPEQGRDLLVVKDIVVNHKLVLIGSKTDIDGIFHGPLFYYLMVLPFILSKGNPVFISLFLIFVNCLSVYFIYILGRELFDRKAGIIAAAILTFSFGSIVMSRWFSNPPLIIPISCLFFLFLARFLKGNKYYLIPSALLFAISGQFDFINFLIFGICVLLIIIFYRKQFLKTPFWILVTSISLLILGSIANFVLFDLRHNFLITNSVISLLTKSKGFYGTFLTALNSSAQNFIKIYSDVIFPSQPLLASLIFLSSLFSLFMYFKKYTNGVKILCVWLASPFLIFVLLKYNSLYHYFGAVIVAIIILTSAFIVRLFYFNKFVGGIFLFFIIVINLVAFSVNLPQNKNVFFESTQPDLKYSDQLAVIKEIYKEANGEPFYFQSYTIPYWQQQGWEYLFWYFGKNTYSYIPENKKTKNLFVIIQNDPNNQIYQNNWLKNTVSGWGTKESEFKYGALKVEKLKVK